MYASRREHLRIPTTNVEVNVASEHNFFLGFSENISEGGLFIATHHLMPIGTVIDVTMSAPPHLPTTTVPCEVRWIRDVDEMTSDCGPGMGLAFRELPPDVHAAIHAFIAHAREALFVDL